MPGGCAAGLKLWQGGGVDDPWGLDDTPADQPIEVWQADGWRTLGEESFWQLLPAAWSAEHRRWLRAPESVRPTSPRRPRPSGPGEDEAEAAGLPAPPRGRRWLLRSPIGWLSLETLVHLIRWRTAQTAGEMNEFHPTYVLAAARELFSWDEADLERWLAGVDRGIVGRWRSRGRAGDGATALILAGVTPGDLDELEALGVNEAQALAWAGSTWRRGPDLVAAVTMWRSRGVAADPPVPLHHFDDWADVDAWLAIGFELTDLAAIDEIPLPRAILWRDAGYSLADTAAWYFADEEITMAEAAAYDVPDAHYWAYRGFNAAEARGWVDAGIDVERARVWRARGLGPHHVLGEDRLPPGSRTGGWVGRRLDDPAFIPQVDDPPGTRGRRALNRRSNPQA
jgi:hypothetical protein